MKSKSSFSDRFKYRFDAMMAKGNGSMVKMLVLVTLILITIIAVLIFILTPVQDRDLAGSFWDVLATAVNAWMPYSDEGGAAHILLTALAAVAGLLFTSILIGIIATAIEEKVTGLKDGNSVVLEKDHVVVLGYVPGEYTLIRQLIAGAGEEKLCIVVAGSQPKSEIEDDLRSNVEIPKNVKIACRSVEPGNITDMAVCSIPECKTVVVNQPDDISTVKSEFAACQILAANDRNDAKVIANVSSKSFLLSREISSGMNLINVCLSDVIARVIAHTCTETGLSRTYSDLFDIEGARIRLLSLPETDGMTFARVLRTMNGAVPIGIASGKKILLNPEPEVCLKPGDSVICLSEDGKEISFSDDTFGDAGARGALSLPEPKTERTVVIGGSCALETLLRELPEQPNDVTVACVSPERYAELIPEAQKRQDVTLTFFDGDIGDEGSLHSLLEGKQHVVILTEGDDNDEGDVASIMRYLQITDLKRREGLSFSVTMELRSEKNLQLFNADSDSDFIVAPHIVSMFLAQLADCPGIVNVFKELLSNFGSEIHTKPVSVLGQDREMTCAEIRACLAEGKMIFLGYLQNGCTVLNPALDTPLRISSLDRLIVISEN